MAFYWSKFTCIITNYDYRGSYKTLNVQYFFDYPNTKTDCSIREFDVHTRVVGKELCKQIVLKNDTVIEVMQTYLVSPIVFTTPPTSQVPCFMISQ